MSFLQPLLLAALPLIALPIIIHLINRNRHRSVPWAAMMFLLNANRMNKGMARLRYVLIMLLRMAAVAAVIFALSRPLVSGKFSSMGMGKPDATLVLLDRSVSMEAQDLQSGESKRSTALKKLAELLEKRSYGNLLVLVDSATGETHLIESPAALLDIPMTNAVAASADIPAMLETGLAYLKTNEAGRADVWICSDLNENDWSPESGRWTAIRDQFREMKGVHHFLLAYSEPPSGNLSVRVENVRRKQTANRAELVMDIFVNNDSGSLRSENAARIIPVEFQINNVRSTVEMELDSAGASLLGHRIPVESALESGWGSVSLPGDTNPLDNTFYFVFSQPPVRNAVIVTDNPKIGEAFRLGLAIPLEPGLEQNAEVIATARAAEIDWENTALVVWQAPLPNGAIAEELENMADTGRTVMFFPPETRDDGEMFGMSWGDWQQLNQGDERKVSWWRGDADLLAHVGSGDALPLSDLRTYQYRALTSVDGQAESTPLAKLENEMPLVLRAATDRGGVYFFSTLPTAQFSSLERDAIAFYVLLQRAMADGSRSLSAATQHDADAAMVETCAELEMVAPDTDAPLVSERGLQAGVFRDGNKWLALNRSAAEDEQRVAAIADVDLLFEGLSYQRIDDAVGDTSSLASEVWRIFLILMATALVLEAVLCLPEKRIERKAFADFAEADAPAHRESA